MMFYIILPVKVPNVKKWKLYMQTEGKCYNNHTHLCLATGSLYHLFGGEDPYLGSRGTSFTPQDF